MPRSPTSVFGLEGYPERRNKSARRPGSANAKAIVPRTTPDVNEFCVGSRGAPTTTASVLSARRFTLPKLALYDEVNHFWPKIK
jgi:hypothetical protein